MRISGWLLPIALLGLPAPSWAQSNTAWLDQPPPSRVLQPLEAAPPIATPVISSDRLAVPNAPIPTSRPEDPGVPRLLLSDRSFDPSSGNPPPPPQALAEPSGPRYRLLVQVHNSAEQQSLISLVPDAFADSRGRMQAGIFRDRQRADQLLQSLSSLGLAASLEVLP
ncbi:hypothetical protein [Synechococcus elongatus]|uniref:SPOR domain-containing protein n=1 Tax=Synechococcus elongatus (strain ATCC 33912 / PCC 7942 / FACHB-805) TaxID=1140 RepID=Q31MP8_SYNE7|nr:hypothetical protein [Synechococcus elongatus]ABB57671.1 hypothetical protein Synpcc7942_1641 [Synechococcus elongatus PCC 7942 = FACHB-805]AJD58887.1 hypothetical protein M744_08280 [Synechococcus elongatus UTEX 2973]MBD2586386.1 hypothetical protein [Synechococcus elongatus FACHB-242]MBD2687460.1 hypothetical protein [Synechococcus elongatus FACHB-1061]MBD2706831.1 hypothetical protein [Synechococcus elongatus PCC 7942 = FACHB-805]